MITDHVHAAMDALLRQRKLCIEKDNSNGLAEILKALSACHAYCKGCDE